MDGKYYHNYPHGRKLDIIHNKELIEKGYNVLRFWEDMFDENKVLNRIYNSNIIIDGGLDGYINNRRTEII